LNEKSNLSGCRGARRRVSVPRCRDFSIESDKVLFNEENKAARGAGGVGFGLRTPKRKKRTPSSRTGILLLFTPTLNNPFYAELVQTVESYADSCGYCVIVCNTLRKPELEKYYLDTFLKTRVDGMIFTFLPSFPEIVEHVADSVPSVLIGEKRASSRFARSSEQRARGQDPLEHLYALGHRKFLFVSTPFNQLTLARQQRLEGIRAFLRAQGLGGDSLELLASEAQTETDSLPDANAV
jgi:LacI family transcriptional regulator